MLSRFLSYPFILLASFFAISPHYIKGFPLGHSTYFNVFWHKHFYEQLTSGELLPRWLFNYLDGLGSPVFYFYAPSPFYLFSLVEAFIGNGSNQLTVFTISHLILYFLSGIAFHTFISPHTDKYWAVVCSILYIFVPYHYVDLEIREAVGEAAAYIWLPLIMHALCRPQKRIQHLFFSGLCYTGLILSHLPSALLTAPVIVFFSLSYLTPQKWYRGIIHSAIVGTVGLLASAFYIIPALKLRGTLPPDAWVTASGPHYKAANWLIGTQDIPSFGVKVYLVLGLTTIVTLTVLILYRIMTTFFHHFPKNRTAFNLVIPALVSLIFCWFMMSLLSKPLWETIPQLSQVQFPWRLGVIVDFCSIIIVAITLPVVLLCLVDRFLTSRLIKRWSHQFIVRSTTSLSLFFISCVVILVCFAPETITIDKLESYDPVEYRPKWLIESRVYASGTGSTDHTDINTAYKYHEVGIEKWRAHISQLPLIDTLRPKKKTEYLTLDTLPVTQAQITALLESPTTIRIKKTYYPHWQLIDNEKRKTIAIYPDIETGLINFDLPSGKHNLTLKRTLLPIEKTGWAISFLTICICCIITWLCTRKSV